MAQKLPHGNGVYDLLIDIIMNLSPKQAENLYSELLPRYTRRSNVSLYNEKGELDSNGEVRLFPLQYQTIRVQFGDTFMKKAFEEVTNYIHFLESHLDQDTTYKAKLRKLKSTTHNNIITQGWVFNKCKSLIVKDRPKINVNPYNIEDFVTARKYIESLPIDIRQTALEVKMLMIKFPELTDLLSKDKLSDDDS